MKEYSNCPICNHNEFVLFKVCTDETVSKNTFKIVECKNCKFKFTNPIPLETEIGKYYESEEYISHSNTSKTFIDKLYQTIRKYTIKKKFKLVKKFSNPKTLLDIGSGTGEFLAYSSRNGLTVNGIEPSEEARNFSINNYNLDVSDESKLNEFLNESFDAISMWHVLEHVYHLNDRIAELKRLIKPAGKIFIAVPNCSSFDAKYYDLNWAAYDVPRHLYHFTPENMNALMEKHGLKVIKTLPMVFDSYYVSMLSEKYKTSKSNFIKAMCIGLLSNFKAIGKSKFSSQIYVIEKA